MNIGLVRLIDRVVGQVDESLLKVRFRRRLVASLFEIRENRKLTNLDLDVWVFTYCAEACQAFIADERFDRIETHDHYVDAEVEFDAVEQQWLRQVALHDDVFVLERVWKISQCLEQSD